MKDAVAAIGEAAVQVTKSQIVFRRRKGFAYVWRPGQYVKSEVPAVLSIALPRELTSDRFKSVVHPRCPLGKTARISAPAPRYSCMSVNRL